MHFYVNIEKENGQGQDAGAACNRWGIVCDGLGGRSHEALCVDGETACQESRYASRIVCQTLQQVFDNLYDEWKDRFLAASAWDDLETVCGDIRSLCRSEIIKVLEQAVRDFPDKKLTLATTVACWIVFPWPDGTAVAVALWAGDSRCYLLDEKQLHVYSKDDVEMDVDAVQEYLLGGSIPMNNRVGVDFLRHPDRQGSGGFWLNSKLVHVEAPAMLAAVSDGLYNLKTVRSPMAAEVVLRSTANYDTVSEIEKALSEYFEKFKTDDTTVAAVYVGFEDLAKANQTLKRRSEQVLARYVDKNLVPVRPKPVGPGIVISDERARIARDLISRTEYTEAVCERALALAQSGETGVPEGLRQPVMMLKNNHQRLEDEETKKMRAELEERKARHTEKIREAEEKLRSVLKVILLNKDVSRCYDTELADLVAAIKRGSDTRFQEASGYIKSQCKIFCAGLDALIWDRCKQWYGENPSVPDYGIYPDEHPRFDEILRTKSQWNDYIDRTARAGIQNLSNFKPDLMISIGLAFLDRLGTTDYSTMLRRILYSHSLEQRPMNPSECDQLFRWICSPTTNVNLPTEYYISLGDVKLLFDSAEEWAVAKDELEQDQLRRPKAVSVPWTVPDEVRTWVSSNSQYAQKVVIEWYKNGSIPFGIIFPQSLCTEFDGMLDKVHDLEAMQETDKKSFENYRDQWASFWAPYRKKYECWDELQYIDFALKDDILRQGADAARAAAKAQEAKEQMEKASPAESAEAEIPGKPKPANETAPVPLETQESSSAESLRPSEENRSEEDTLSNDVPEETPSPAPEAPQGISPLANDVPAAEYTVPDSIPETREEENE